MVIKFGLRLGMGAFWILLYVLFWALGASSTCGHFEKIHQTVHLLFVHFSVCLLYLSKSLNK